ncbi:dihydrodipicolinate reductase [Candidatus Kinetoplastibacterium blastocrithidii TCC012E]|uniref:4-hydroxy-tetrahydrodipicolinate reductase n=1 Tax=Candidatus Kinetoplastidibacterium blastocrithidiae TCC012E TaxID=1208922 RepID=M1LBX9_9PROT|nr:4-hydroxy-tetrahydrodipicolinate reductase [Candidatus Kinetoplastibacterium blastocrithidii]AFZ83833.1 DapB [Candidatus Kinetoplastibacterium blastocrithidii (ex Strigomonas culicis)]AGF49958.1 dihydrodipicolinate reductase [Candidatus Kinetoplastibacterium blastocrithidii TCC012E]
MRLAVSGSSGRMGSAIIKTLLKNPELQLLTALDSSNSKYLGQKIEDCNISLTDDLDTLKEADCLIDFTRPEATMKYLSYCLKHNVNMVIGTTGFSEDELKVIEQASKTIAIMHASNTSIGVNATIKLIELASKILKSGYDVEIFEAHHSEKVDSPSGTSITMGEAIAKTWEVSLPEVATWSRHGYTGPRKKGTIGFSVMRGGDIVGDHSVYFCGQGERIEITHRSTSRENYINGAIQAALFLKNKKNGKFNMNDVLSL